MADNTSLNSGTGGDTIATDELTTLNGLVSSGVKVQRVKVGFGSDNDLRDVDAGNGLPVVGPLTDTQLRATAVPVSLATNTPDVTDRAARLLGVVASITAALPAGANTLGAITGTTTDNAANPALKLGTLPGVALAAAPVRTEGAVNPLRLNLAGDAAITLDGEAVVLGAGTASVGTVVLTAETTKVIGTINIATAQTLATVTTVSAVTAITNALPAGTNNIGDVDVLTLPALVAGTAVIGALVANQSVNKVQIGGVAIAVGSGVSGTGVQRVVLATDVVQPALSEIRAATLHVSVTAAVNTALTASLPAPAAGLFHYITAVELVKLYAVLGVAAAAGVIVTTTNMPGSMAFTTEQAAGPLGTAPKVVILKPATPIRSAVAATATTFVAPAQTQTIWRWNISYFTAV